MSYVSYPEQELVVGVTCFAIEMTYGDNVHDFSGD